MSRTGDGVATEPPRLHRQVGSAIRWSAVNSVVQRVCQVGVGVLLARLIAPDQFGVYAVALVVLNIVLSVSEMGVSVALVRTTGDIRAMAPTVATLSLLSGATLALLCVLGAPWFAEALNAPAATGVLQLMSVALLLAGASAVPAAVLQRNLRQDQRFAADSASFVVGTAVAVVLALLGFGAWSLAWSRIATNATSAIMMFALVKERYRPGFDRDQARSLLAFGLPLAGSSLLVFGVYNIDYIVVGSVIGPVELAFYLLAFNLASWPVGAFSQPVRSVSVAAFSRVRDDAERFSATFARALGLLALFTVPASVLLGAYAGPLVRLVYGERWSAAAEPLGLLVLLGAARVGIELAYDYLASAGRTRVILGIHLVWLGTLVPASIAGAQLGGIRGVAASTVVVVVVVVVPAYLLALRPSGIKAQPLLRAVARPALGGAVMIAVAVAVQRLVGGDLAQLAVGTVLSLTGYALVVARLRHDAFRVLRRTADG